jgi:hypothetical protein
LDHKIDTVNHPSRPKHIVVATVGSLGDLHPCLALGRELSQNGHRVTIATTPYYRSKVEGLGLSFSSMRPDWDPTDTKLIRSCEDLRRGLEVLYREMLLPELNHMYLDLLSVAEDADLLIAGELVYAAPLAAEKLSLPWVTDVRAQGSGNQNVPRDVGATPSMSYFGRTWVTSGAYVTRRVIDILEMCSTWRLCGVGTSHGNRKLCHRP